MEILKEVTLEEATKMANKIDGWCYGFIEEEHNGEKALVLAEIYFDKKRKPIGAAYVDWKDVLEEIKENDFNIIEDLEEQIATRTFFVNEKNKLKIKKWIK